MNGPLCDATLFTGQNGFFFALFALLVLKYIEDVRRALYPPIVRNILGFHTTTDLWFFIHCSVAIVADIVRAQVQ